MATKLEKDTLARGVLDNALDTYRDALLNNKAALSALVASGDVVITGEADHVVATLGAFEVDGLRS